MGPLGSVAQADMYFVFLEWHSILGRSQILSEDILWKTGTVQIELDVFFWIQEFLHLTLKIEPFLSMLSYETVRCEWLYHISLISNTLKCEWLFSLQSFNYFTNNSGSRP